MRDLLVPGDVYIAGLGVYLPGEKMSVRDAIDRGLCDPETAQVGWKAARIAGEMPAPDMAIRAANQAIAQSGHPPEDFALLLHACAWHQGPEGWSPHHYIQRHTIGGNSLAVGLRQGCNAALASMELAIPYLISNDERKAALICSADNFGTPLYDRWRAHRAVVYGDAGAAMVLSTQGGFARVLAVGSKSMPQFEELGRGVEPLFPPGVTVGRPLDFEERMAGYESDLLYQAREHVPTLGAEIVKLTLEAAGLSIADVARVVHQATGSEMFLQVLLGPLGVETERGVLGFGQDNGRFGAADQVAGLAHLVQQGELAEGDHVLLLGGGPGMTATAAVLRIQDVPAWTAGEAGEQA
jgi:3-oxoacyl-[acyl-carrier-protein] synthase-3